MLNANRGGAKGYPCKDAKESIIGKQKDVTRQKFLGMLREVVAWLTCKARVRHGSLD